MNEYGFVVLAVLAIGVGFYFFKEKIDADRKSREKSDGPYGESTRPPTKDEDEK